MKKNALILAFFMLLSTLGCQKDVNLKVEDMSAFKNDTNFVNLELAKKIASVQAPDGSISGLRGMSTTYTRNSKSILKTTVINPEESQPTFYIFNYDGGGFAIVSADMRTSPILAYSDNGSFPIGTDIKYPPGLVGWLESTHKNIKYIRKSNIQQQKLSKLEWNTYQKEKLIQDEKASIKSPEIMKVPDTLTGNEGYYGGPCHTEGETILITTELHGPLVNTLWGQGTGYNDLLTFMNCPLYANGKPPVGCVATAMAQVMKYHQKPTSYSWSLMPNVGSSTQIQQLMKDIGALTFMDYDCDGSSTTNGKAVSAFRNFLGYTAAETGSYNWMTVRDEIRNNRPVILGGGRQAKWWIFNVFDDGHSWVCEGYKERVQFKCFVSDDPRPPVGSTGYIWNPDYYYMYSYMNWGWQGQYNGWFNSNWNPGTHTFNYLPDMITKIY